MVYKLKIGKFLCVWELEKRFFGSLSSILAVVRPLVLAGYLQVAPIDPPIPPVRKACACLRSRCFMPGFPLWSSPGSFDVSPSSFRSQPDFLGGTTHPADCMPYIWCIVGPSRPLLPSYKLRTFSLFSTASLSPPPPTAPAPHGPPAPRSKCDPGGAITALTF